MDGDITSGYELLGTRQSKDCRLAEHPLLKDLNSQIDAIIATFKLRCKIGINRLSSR